MANEKYESTAKKAEGSSESSFANVSGNSGPESKVKSAMGSAQEALGDAKDYVQESCEAVSARINSKPVQSALIALGVGYVLAKLLK